MITHFRRKVGFAVYGMRRYFGSLTSGVAFAILAMLSTTLLSLSQLESNESSQANAWGVKTTAGTGNVKRILAAPDAGKKPVIGSTFYRNLKLQPQSKSIPTQNDSLYAYVPFPQQYEGKEMKASLTGRIAGQSTSKVSVCVASQKRSTGANGLLWSNLVAWFDREAFNRESNVLGGESGKASGEVSAALGIGRSSHDANDLNQGWRYGRTGWVKLQNEVGVQPLALTWVQRLSPLFWASLLWAFATALLVWAS